MKKLMLLACLALAGCNGRSILSTGMDARQDKETGCWYLTLSTAPGGVAITPRMKADGHQMCEGGK